MRAWSLMAALALALAVGIGPAMAAGAATQATTPDISAVIARIQPSVVNISAITEAGMMAMMHGAGEGSTRDAKVETSLGTGFIVDPKGLIVTNRHVIAGATLITVTLQDGRTYTARVVAAANILDIALLRIDPEVNLPAVTLGDSAALRVGQRVIAIGNPLGLGGTVTEGIVSALNRNLGSTPADDFIQTDAAINHGNSGGPLFNEQGQVIGIDTAFETPSASSNGSVGLGFAIPIDHARYVIDMMRRYGTVRAGTLEANTQALTPPLAEALGIAPGSGVIVVSLTPDGPAAKAGLAVGDVIENVDHGPPIAEPGALVRAVQARGPGYPMTMTVLHEGKPRTLAVVLGTWPDANAPVPQRPAKVVATMMQMMGMRAVPAGFTIIASTVGCQVTTVVAGQAAAVAGIAPGDHILMVQQRAVRDGPSLAAAMEAARETGRTFAAVLVEHGAAKRWVALPLMAGK